MAWEPPVFETDPDAATARILDGMREKMPEWEDHEGAPEVVLAEEIGREAVLLGQQLEDQLLAIVTALGQTIYGLSPRAGIPATLLVDIATTKADVAIPAGLVVIGTTPAGAEVAFRLPETVIATTTVTRVTLYSTDPTSDANGVPSGQTLRVATATATVVAAVSASGSSGGSAPETPEQYASRLTGWLGALRPGGVTGADLAAFAPQVPGVVRALGVDLYDPAAPLVDTERSVTVFPIDADGKPVTPQVAANVAFALAAYREVNFLIHVAEPTYTGVDVVATVQATVGADHATVEAAVEAAVAAWLSPATWGAPNDDPSGWVATPLVRYLDAANVIGSVPGVASITTLTLNGGTVDVTLPGKAALPSSTTGTTDPSTVSVTVV